MSEPTDLTTQDTTAKDTPPADATPAKADPAPTPPADGSRAPKDAPETGGTQGADATKDKPFLGNPPTDGDGNKTPTTGDGQPDDTQNAPQPPDEKAYLDAVRKDEGVFGKDDALEFDQRLVKSVIPVCQKHGISPEAANALANAFAKAQLDGAREGLKERAARFQKMNGEARAKYSDQDFEQINRGIDKWFRPGGVMNAVVRNSELGSDPEFLALMHRLGAAEREDAGKGAAAGGDGSAGQEAGFAGIAAAWK